MGMGWVIFLVIDSNEVEVITRNFFAVNFTSVEILDKTLQDEIWFVKVLLTSFGAKSDKTLSIESKTGRVISCE
jgi:hypothetical protein